MHDGPHESYTNNCRPVGVVLIAAILGVLLWRRRKRNRQALALRKEEADQYSFHPNESSAPFGSAGTGATAVMTQYGTRPDSATPYRGWQPTAARQTTTDPVFQQNTQQKLHGNRQSALSADNVRDQDVLEVPTLPAFISEDLESVPGSPRVSATDRNDSRTQTSPGNGSPPLDAIMGEQLQRDDSNIDVSAFMPPVQTGPQRTPYVHRTSGSADDQRRYSYTNF
jgi:hypothetical protein